MIKEVKSGWLAFTHILSQGMIDIFLILIYVFVVGATATFAKILHKEFLPDLHKSTNSYWRKRKPAAANIDKYFDQF
jgi:hypothetical protein